MPNESSTFPDILGIEEEEVNYDSNTKSKLSTPLCEDSLMKAPYPFPERGAPDALTAVHMKHCMGSVIITSPLDEEPERGI